MRLTFVIILFVISVWSCSTPTEDDQPPCDNSIFEDHSASFWNRDYGLGIVDYSYFYNHPNDYVIQIYSEPDTLSEVVAHYSVDNWTLYFVESDSCIRSSRQIEWDYEILGFAILAFNSDSSFAEVSLDPWNISNPPKGWIHLLQANFNVLFWSEYLLERTGLFFMNPDSISFFEDQSLSINKDISLVATENERLYDYIMKPIEANDLVLKVELYTPSTLCGNETLDIVPDTVWIRYLKPDGRPRVFYYARGC